MTLLEHKLGGQLSRTIMEFRTGKRERWIKRSMLKVRSLIVHQLDQKIATQEDVEKIRSGFRVNRERYRNMRRTIRRGFERGLLTEQEYESARVLLGSREQQYNVLPLAEKVTIEALASLVLTEQMKGQKK